MIHVAAAIWPCFCLFCSKRNNSMQLQIAAQQDIKAVQRLESTNIIIRLFFRLPVVLMQTYHADECT